MRSLRAHRLSALALVALAHAVALYGLVGLTGPRTGAPETDAESPLVWVLSPPSPTAPRFAPVPPPRRSSGGTATARSDTAPSSPSPAQQSAPARIDWDAEAAAAAHALEQKAEAGPHTRTFAIPPPSPIFASPPPHPPAIGWDYAATHRVEAEPNGVTIIHVNDHCVVGFFIVLPFFGCALGKIPARGDLFDHRHDDPDPGEPR